MWRLDRRGPVQSWRAIRHAHSQAKVPTMFCQRSDQVINLHRAHAVFTHEADAPFGIEQLDAILAFTQHRQRKRGAILVTRAKGRGIVC